MNLQDAVTTINRLSLRKHSKWVIQRLFGTDCCVQADGLDRNAAFTEFEAIAIAKALVEQEQTGKSATLHNFRPANTIDIEKLERRIGAHESSVGFAQRYSENLEERIHQLEAKLEKVDAGGGKPDHFVDLHNKRLHILEAKFRESHPPFRFVPEAEVKTLVREFLKDAVVVIAEAK